MNHGYIFAVLSFERFLAPSMSLCRSVWLRVEGINKILWGRKKKFIELLLDFHRPFSFSLPNINRHNAMVPVTPFSLTLSVYTVSVSFLLAAHLYPHLCPYHRHNSSTIFMRFGLTIFPAQVSHVSNFIFSN